MFVSKAPVKNRDWISLAAASWLAGFSALVCDHFQFSQSLVFGTHTVFAMATFAAISVVMFARARALAGVPRAELYQFTRLVSRWVYILMYALAVVRIMIYLYEANAGSPRPIEDFQLYVMCCLVPLWLIRVIVLAIPCKAPAATTYELGRDTSAQASHFKLYDAPQQATSK